MESLEILGKLTRNIAVNPADPKFRKLRLSNAKLKEAVVDTPGALSSLMAMGWQQDDAETESLIFPAGRQLTMAQVIDRDSILPAYPTIVCCCMNRICRACSADSRTLHAARRSQEQQLELHQHSTDTFACSQQLQNSSACRCGRRCTSAPEWTRPGRCRCHAICC